MSGRLVRVLDWFEERSGYRALIRAALDEPVPGGPRARYVFGSVLVFLILNQTVTGFLLAAGYAPSVHDAWSSVAYLQEVAPLGWFIRGMHSAGASAALCVVVLHLAQVTWAGAYKRPRELTWWVGLALLGLLFAFSLSGYLLPWDEKGYFATQVATSLIGATPLVGEAAQRVVQGGSSYGNLTLTRFYATHVLLLPALLVVFVVAHIVLFRRNGVTPPAAFDAARTRTFYPMQVALDLGAIVLCVGTLVVWVVRTHGVSLEAPADPASSYEARPEWYFLPLFQLLRHLPGSLELVGAFGVPLIAGGLLVALPFIGRAASRVIVATLVLGSVVLGITAIVEDAHDPSFAAGRERADREADLARSRFLTRIGKAKLDTAGRHALGAALFDQHCSSCHVRGGHGDPRAPALDGWSSRAWIDAFLAAPNDARFFGRTEFHDMKPVMVTGADRAALVEWIWSLGGSDGADAQKVVRGAALFEELSCSDCHEKDGHSEGNGIPNLGGRASAAWLQGLLRDAGGPTYFGRKNTMPRFGDKLSEDELAALVEWLRSERIQ